MAQRMFNESQLHLQKRVRVLFGVVSVGAAGAVTLQRWIYPKLGQGVVGTTVQTYAAAPTTAPLATAGAYPTQYQRGSEGVGGVTRTAAGLWTVTLQDNYQRLLQATAHQSIAGGLSNIIAVGENSTITNMMAAGGSIIGLALLSATATAADPTAGSSIIFRLELHDASEP